MTAFSHDDVQAHLIDFLYGELTGEARAAFDAHVAGCARCQAEVAGLQKTRRLTRDRLREGLADAPPVGLAERALAARPSPSRASAPVAPVAPPASAWRRWLEGLRGRWALPTLATVGAMAAVLLGREMIFRESRKPISEEAIARAVASRDDVSKRLAPPAALSPSVGQLAEPNAVDESDKLADQPAAPRRAEGTSRGSSEGASAGAGTDRARRASLRAKAAPVTSMPAKHAAKAKDQPPAASADGLGGLVAPSSGGLGAAKGVGTEQAEGAAPLAKAAPATDRKFVIPPPPRPAPVATKAAPAPAPAPPAAASRASTAAHPPSAQAPAAEAPAPAPAAPSPSGGPVGSATRPPTQSPAQSSMEDRRADADPVAPQVTAAERLMTARRFAEAVVAYKDLLRRYPGHANAVTWRRRLAVAERSLADAGTGPGPGSERGFAKPPPAR